MRRFLISILFWWFITLCCLHGAVTNASFFDSFGVSKNKKFWKRVEHHLTRWIARWVTWYLPVGRWRTARWRRCLSHAQWQESAVADHFRSVYSFVLLMLPLLLKLNKQQRRKIHNATLTNRQTHHVLSDHTRGNKPKHVSRWTQNRRRIRAIVMSEVWLQLKEEERKFFTLQELFAPASAQKKVWRQTDTDKFQTKDRQKKDKIQNQSRRQSIGQT